MGSADVQSNRLLIPGVWTGSSDLKMWLNQCIAILEGISVVNYSLPLHRIKKYYIKNVLCKEPYTFKLWAFHIHQYPLKLTVSLSFDRRRKQAQRWWASCPRWPSKVSHRGFLSSVFQTDPKFPRMGIKPSLPAQAALLYDSPEGCEVYSLMYRLLEMW